MNAGIMLGAKIDHLATDPVSKILATKVNTNNNNNNGTNEKLELAIRFAKNPVSTTPKLLSLIRATNYKAKNTIKKTPPIDFI